MHRWTSVMTTEGASLAPLEAFAPGAPPARAQHCACIGARPARPGGAAGRRCSCTTRSLFIVQMSFTDGQLVPVADGPVQTLDNYALMFERYLPNLLVTVQLAFLATVVDLVFGFPFAYILVRRVRYRDVVRALMVFPMFGALYVAFGMRLHPAAGRAARRRSCSALGIPDTALLFSLPAVVFAMSIFTFPFMVMSIGTALSQRRPDARGGGRLPRRAAVADVPAGRPAAHPGGRRRGHAAGLRLEHRDVRRAAPARRRSTSSARSRWTLYQRGVVQTDYGLSSRWASCCWSSRSS